MGESTPSVGMGLHDRATLQRFVAEVAQLRELAGSCIGPLGKLKIVRGGADGSIVYVTSSSHRLLGNVSVHSPFARLLVELCRAQRGRSSDGGLLALSLAAGLVVDGSALGIGRHALCATLEACLALCHAAMLEGEWPLGAHMHWRDLALPSALARSVIGAKRAALLADAELEHVSALAVEAFVQTFPTAGAAAAEGGSAAQCVRTQGVVGASPMRSHLVEGVLMDARPPSGCPESLPDGASVALFDIVLDGAPPPAQRGGGREAAPDVAYEFVEGAAEAAAPGPGGGPPHAEGAEGEGAGLVLCAFADWMAARGVGIVASQKVISPRLQALLIARHILPLERLSLRHIDAVRRVSGAQVQSAMTASALRADALGAVGELGTRRVGRHALTLLTPPRQGPAQPAGAARARAVVTLVLCSQTPGALEELTAAIGAAQRALAHATRDTRVCPGGGATEWLLAERVRDEAAAWRRSGAHPIGLGARQGEVQAACGAFASALEAVPLAMARALGESGAQAGEQGALMPRTELRDASGRVVGISYAGCDAALGRIGEVMRARRVAGGGADEPPELEVSAASVLDLASAKMHAIASAVHVATVLLKVDHSIHASADDEV